MKDAKSGDQVRVVAESETGVVYHDQATDEWLLDIGPRGITLFFDREEFSQLAELIRKAAEYQWEVRDERRTA